MASILVACVCTSTALSESAFLRQMVTFMMYSNGEPWDVQLRYIWPCCFSFPLPMHSNEANITVLVRKWSCLESYPSSGAHSLEVPRGS